MTSPELIDQIRWVADDMARKDGSGPWSTGERIAGAFLNGRMDWLPGSCPHPLDALMRLGDEWRSAIFVIRERDINGRG